MATAGIDFGTTNSVVSIWTSSGPKVLNIDEPADHEWAGLGFDSVMPTILGVNSARETLFGWAAKLDPDLPVLEAVKRLMAGSDLVRVGDDELLTEQVVAMFFRHLASQAALVGGEAIDRVVVTVPANSRGIARHRTKLCAQLAGLEVLTLINEPTAAAMAATSRMAHDGKVLVVDWGGGTLDVTALDSRGGVFIEQSSSGIPMLGGRDFDAKLSAFVLESTPEVVWTPTLRRQFALEIEKAKIRLSDADFTVVTRPAGGPMRVTREMFDAATEPLVRRLRGLLEQCLVEAGWTPSTVDHVLLVGGTCKIPAVRTLVAEVLGKAPTAGVNPMTAISEGAAVAAAIMTGELDNDFFVSTEHALGTVVTTPAGEDYFSEIIRKGHKLPAVGREVYQPLRDDQEQLLVVVVEGDPALPLGDDLNVQIAQWEFELPPPDRGDDRSFMLEYRYDVEGILHVKATDGLTGAVMLDETVGSKASHDRRQLVQIANAAQSSVDSGTLKTQDTGERSGNPEAEAAIQSAQTRVIPFVDDAEAESMRGLVAALRAASGAQESRAALDALRTALSRYSYLL